MLAQQYLPRKAGISEGVKFVQAFFTFIVFFPSLLTAFALAASFESVSWAKGRRVWFGWIRDILWGGPSLAAQVLAMLLFIFGGAGGLINASYSLDLIIHNTAWIVGHFHRTVGSAVALTFMGDTYWLVPHLAGRPLWNRRLALAQVWTWTSGMVLFSATLHYLGTLGMIRRTDMAISSFVDPSWQVWFPAVDAGGVVLFASCALFFVNVVLTVWRSPRAVQAPIPFAEFIHRPASTPAFFDRRAPWLVITVALLVIAYGPVVVQFVSQPAPVVQGLRGSVPWRADPPAAWRSAVSRNCLSVGARPTAWTSPEQALQMAPGPGEARARDGSREHEQKTVRMDGTVADRVEDVEWCAAGREEDELHDARPPWDLAPRLTTRDAEARLSTGYLAPENRRLAYTNRFELGLTAACRSQFGRLGVSAPRP